MPTCAVGVELCRVGVQRVWSSIEDVTLVFGAAVRETAARIRDVVGTIIGTPVDVTIEDVVAS